MRLDGGTGKDSLFLFAANNDDSTGTYDMAVFGGDGDDFVGFFLDPGNGTPTFGPAGFVRLDGDGGTDELASDQPAFSQDFQFESIIPF